MNPSNGASILTAIRQEIARLQAVGLAGNIEHVRPDQGWIIVRVSRSPKYPEEHILDPDAAQAFLEQQLRCHSLELAPLLREP